MLVLHLAAAMCAAQLFCAAPAPATAAAPVAKAPVPAPAAPDDTPPLLQLGPDVRPIRYALDLEIDPSKDGFRGQAEIEIALETKRSTIWLHGRGLRVFSARVTTAAGANVAVTYRQVNDDGVARLDLPVPVGPGAATLRLAWETDWGPGGYGLSRARSGGDSYAATHLEPSHARRVFPGFDEPRFKTPFDVSIAVPDGAVAISNGAEASSDPLAGGGRRVRFGTTKPLPSYLLFFGVGPWEVVTAPAVPPNPVRSEPLPLRGFAPRGRGTQLDLALRETAAVLEWQERWFGIAYPYGKLDTVAVPGPPHGGMENAGAIAYADRFILLDEARAGLQQRLTLAGMVAHEVAHLWFGDLVTLPWWTEIWLNESFATWMSRRTFDALHPEWDPSLDVRRGRFMGGEPPALAAAVGGVDWTMQGDALATARAVRRPLERMADVGAQFDAASYSKGAAVLATFERWMGPEAFREGVRAFLQAHAHGTGSTPELLEALSRAAGRDVAGPMTTLLDRPGVPLVSARLACEGASAGVRLSQSPLGVAAPGATEPWWFPVCVRYRAQGAERERCQLLETAESVLPIPEGCPEWIFPNAGAAGYYRFALAPEDLDRLLRRGLKRLTTLEKVALAGDVRAVQRAGRLPYAQAMDLLATLARDPDPAVAASAMPALTHAHRNLVDPRARRAVEAYARALYAPALRRLGWTSRATDRIEDRRYRAELVRFLLRTGRDAAATLEAARRGAAYLGSAGAAPAPDAVDPDLVEDAVAAAVGGGGAPALEAAASLAFSTPDAAARWRILSGIGAGGRPELVPRIFEIAREPRLAAVERVSPIETAFKDSGTRGAALDALERAAADVVQAFARKPLLAHAISWQCDARAADRVQEIFEPMFVKMPDLRLPMAEAIARIRACAAEREAEGDAATRWFERRARRAAR